MGTAMNDLAPALETGHAVATEGLVAESLERYYGKWRVVKEYPAGVPLPLEERE